MTKKTKYDGDIVKGIGYVTLNASYLEEQVDKLLDMLNEVEQGSCYNKYWGMSAKIKHAIKIARRIGEKELSELIEDLHHCKEKFKYRNDMIHGQLYQSIGGSVMLQLGEEQRTIQSDEVYTLSNDFDVLRENIIRLMIRDLPHAILKYISKNNNVVLNQPPFTFTCCSRDVTYFFIPCDIFNGRARYKREDAAIWIAYKSDYGWVCIDSSDNILGIPWGVSLRRGKQGYVRQIAAQGYFGHINVYKHI